MKFLPSTSSSDYATIDFFIMVGAVALPTLAILLIWVLFFRNRRKRKRKRRHHHQEMNPAQERNGRAQRAHDPEDFTDQPKS